MGVTVKPNRNIKTLSQKTLKDVERLKFEFYDWYQLELELKHAEKDEARQVKADNRVQRLSYLCDLMRLVNYLTIHAEYSCEEEVDELH